MDVNEALKFLRKFKKNKLGGVGIGFWGGGGGVRVDVNEKLKFLTKLKKLKKKNFLWGGRGPGSGRGGVELGGQGRCEQRSEVFVKNKKKCGGGFRSVGGGGLGQGGGGWMGGGSGWM